MQLIRSKNTQPEIKVRKLTFSLGYRYRLHDAKLPGRPDIVFPKKRKVIFVHGCFWHQHEGCTSSKIPTSNVDYWKPKLERNKKRDIENQSKLKNDNWSFLILWECELKKPKRTTFKIKNFLEA